MADLPTAIWNRKSAEPRQAMTEDRIVEAALAILDEVGMSGVTMRQVSERLGVTTPTIYWHIQSKEGLLDRLFDRMSAEVELPGPGPWQQRLMELALSIRAVFTRHRGGAALAVGRFPLGPHGLVVTETALAAFSESGMNDDSVANAAFTFFAYITNFANQETVLPLVDGSSAANADRDGTLREIRDYLSSLPDADFPNLVRLAAPLSSSGLDARFIFGLERLLAGMQQLDGAHLPSSSD